MRMFLLIATTLLSGCGTGGSSVVVCPPVAEYSPEEQTRVATEIEAATPYAVWPDWITDYGALRERIRAACPDL